MMTALLLWFLFINGVGYLIMSEINAVPGKGVNAFLSVLYSYLLPLVGL